MNSSNELEHALVWSKVHRMFPTVDQYLAHLDDHVHPSARVLAELIQRDGYDAAQWLLELIQQFGMLQEPVPAESLVRRDVETRWANDKTSTVAWFFEHACMYRGVCVAFDFESEYYWKESTEDRRQRLHLKRREREIEAAYARRDAKTRADYYTSYLLPSARVVAELIVQSRPRADAWLLDMVQEFGMEQEPVPEDSPVRRNMEIRWARRTQTFELFIEDLCEYEQLRDRFGFDSSRRWWEQTEQECAARRAKKLTT